MTDTNRVLSKDDILAAKDISEPKRVPVPEWDGVVFMKEMNGLDRDAFETYAAAKVRDGKMDLNGVRISLLSFVLVDDKGNRIFSNPDDLLKLNCKNGKVLARLGQMAQDMNGLGNQAPEELRKNS